MLFVSGHLGMQLMQRFPDFSTIFVEIVVGDKILVSFLCNVVSSLKFVWECVSH